MAEFEQPQATRDALRDYARDYLAGQISPKNAIDLAKGALSRRELALAVQASSDKPIKYKSALRRVERWFTSASEQRKPSKASQKAVAEALRANEKALQRVAGEQGKFTMTLDATVSVGGDPSPSYTRRRTGITVAFSPEEAQDLLTKALTDPDEAWQVWMDVYVLPGSVIEQPRIRFD